MALIGLRTLFERVPRDWERYIQTSALSRRLEDRVAELERWESKADGWEEMGRRLDVVVRAKRVRSRARRRAAAAERAYRISARLWLDVLEGAGRLPQRVCLNCEMPVWDRSRPFCSAECEHKYHPLEVECAQRCSWCRRWFWSSRHQALDYCSPECAMTGPGDLPDFEAVDWNSVVIWYGPPPSAAARRAWVVTLRKKQAEARLTQPATPTPVPGESGERLRPGSAMVSGGPQVYSRRVPGPKRIDPSAPLMIAPGNGAAAHSDAEVDVLAVIRAAPEGLTRRALLAGAGRRAGDTLAAVAELIAKGFVLRTGAGRSRSPFRFSAAGGLSSVASTPAGTGTNTSGMDAGMDMGMDPGTE